MAKSRKPSPDRDPSSGRSGQRANSARPSTNARPRSGLFEDRTVKDYLIMIRERWFLGLTCAVIFASALLYFQLSKPEVYATSSTLLFEPTPERVMNITSVVDTTLPEGRLQTHIEQLRSASFFEYVATTFTPEEKELIRQAYITPEDPSPNLGGIIRSNLGVAMHRGTYVMSISARHRNPEAAALIANRYANRYIAYNLERAVTGTRSAIVFLKEQADEQRRNVEMLEDQMQDYRAKHNLVSLEENQNVIVQRLNAISTNLLMARSERLDLDAQISQVEAFLKEGRDLLQISLIAEYGSIPALLREAEALESQRSLYEGRYLENHPRMRESRQGIAANQAALKQNIEMAVTELRSRHSRAAQHEKNMQVEMAAAEKAALDLDRIAVNYRVIQRQAETVREAYSAVLARLNEASISEQLESINIRMVDSAWPPSKPVEPNLVMAAIQSVFLGLIAFFGIPLGLGLFDYKLKAAWEVELYLDVLLLGEIPELAQVNKRGRPHLVSQGKEEAACEAFRGLFSQMQLNSSFDPPKRLLITSTVPGEGKSFIANNLAATFAAHEHRTVLVDCDFRRPSLHHYHGQPNSAGIMRWMETESLLDDPDANEDLGIVQLSRNFSLLRSGGESRNPTELFVQPSFRRLIEALHRTYDLVIIDTPPVGIFPDALLLSRYCEETVYVAQFDRVNKSQVRRLLDKLGKSEAAVAGLILNGIPSGRASSYYDYSGYGFKGNKEYRNYYAKKR
jgi:polysaccharide biosynthesis transport protein